MSAVLPILASPTTTTEHSILAATAAAIAKQDQVGWPALAKQDPAGGGETGPSLFLAPAQRGGGRDSNRSRQHFADLLTVEFEFLLSGR